MVLSEEIEKREDVGEVGLKSGRLKERVNVGFEGDPDFDMPAKGIGR